MIGRLSRLLTLVLLWFALLGALATFARSAPRDAAAGRAAASAEATSIPGSGYLDTGFADAYEFELSTPSTASRWLSRAESLGSSYVRLETIWSSIAPLKLVPGFRPADPGDPRYNWSGLDAAVRAALAHGQRVVLVLLNPPPWALGKHPPKSAPAGTWEPNPSALGAFAHAVAERYDGRFPDPQHPGQSLPLVTHFQAWNEPNLSAYLTPQWRRGRAGKFFPVSPYRYRRMLNAVYANVKSVQPHSFVLAGGTAPYGDPPGGGRMEPVVFMRKLLCLSGRRNTLERCPNPAHFDALDNHPYSPTPTYHALNIDNVSVADIGRLRAVLDVAERTGRALPAGRKPIWVTEIAWTSDPPLPGAISEARQARYLSLGFYELWREGVDHVFWLLIRDYPYETLAGSGLYFVGGAAKPSSRAFRFPFVAVRGRDEGLTLWGRAPQAGRVVIERGTAGGWRPVLLLSTTPGGIFYAQRRLGSRLVLRAVSGGIASLAFPTG